MGYTEASRGCKRLCRHCPIVPVYNGRFRIVQPDVVLAGIRQQVTAGAQHITFGDPGFLNGSGHVLPLTPTFVTFTPWTTVRGYAEFLALMAEMALVEAINPIRYAIRLLIPAGSRLLDLAEVRDLVRPFNEAALVYPWVHPDPAVDALYQTIFKLVKAGQNAGESRQTMFSRAVCFRPHLSFIIFDCRLTKSSLTRLLCGS